MVDEKYFKLQMIWVRKAGSFLGVTKCIPQRGDGRAILEFGCPSSARQHRRQAVAGTGMHTPFWACSHPACKVGAKPASAGPEPYPQVCLSVGLSSKTIQKLARFQICKPASHSGTYKWYVVRIHSWLYQADMEPKNWVAKRCLADLSCVLSVRLLVF